MAESPRRPADGSRRPQPPQPEKGQRAPGETMRPADSAPASSGPFARLPSQFGRYRVDKLLGQGSMGAVYLALDVQLDRQVALKVAKVSAGGAAKLLKRMEIEAKAAARLDHSHICKVFDFGEIDGIRFIALQYVEGEDLKSYMRRTGRRRHPAEAVSLILQVAQALEAAHEKGVIHRDLKPENIMLNRKGEPVIMDFGLARRLVGANDAGLTQGMIVGTAAYMSPEQAAGRADGIDHRSDLYALGVMLFEMLTGEWPFTGNAIEVIGKKCVQQPPSPRDIDPKLSPRVIAICDKLIAQKKEDRYADCASLIADLEALNKITEPVVEPKRAPEADLNPFEFGEVSAPPDAPSWLKSARKKSKAKARQTSGASAPPLSNWKRPELRWMTFGGAAVGLLVVLALLLLPRSESKVQFEIKDPELSVRFGGKTFTSEKESGSISVSPEKAMPVEILKQGKVVETASADLTLKKKEHRTVRIAIDEGQRLVISEKSSLVPGDKKPYRRSIQLPEIISKSTGLRLVLIPAGTFQMGAPKAESGHSGDETPQHKVELTRPYYLGVYEVTQGEFLNVLERNPSWFSGTRIAGQETKNLPVEKVSWFDAVEFCNRLSEMDGLTPYYRMTGIVRNNGVIETANVTTVGGSGYRLPTEAEWEHACRANTTTPFFFGGESNGTLANIDGRSPYGTTSTGPNLQKTVRVGSYSANAFGLFDMHGNVAEWCDDVYDRAAYETRNGTTTDPRNLTGSDFRVARGGSWFGAARYSRSAYRSAFTRRTQNEILGFRIACSTVN